MRHSLFYTVIFGFIAGIALRSVGSLPRVLGFVDFWTGMGFILIMCVGLLVFAFQARLVFDQSGKKRYTWFFICIVCLSCSLLGAMRYQAFRSWQGDPQLGMLVDQKVALTGVVVEEPGIKETYAQVIVRIDAINNDNNEGNSNVSLSTDLAQPTKILIQTDVYLHPKYGDRIVIDGQLEAPTNTISPDTRSFDYVSYLAKDKIFYIVKSASWTLIKKGQGNRVMAQVLQAKNHFTDTLDAALPFPESKLAAGLIVAGKFALPKKIQDEFMLTGTSQVVVLSGYNVTIVAETIMGFLSFLPTLLSSIFGSVSIILFALAAGGSATILRSVIMVMIALLGKNIRRKYTASRALMVAGVLMLIANPMLLVFDPSFQLSFLATIGLMYVSPFFEAHMQWVTPRFKLREVMVSTIATQVFVTPFILYLTGAVSLVALPANVLLFFLIPVTMCLSFMTGCLGLFSLVLALPVRFLAFILLTAMLSIVHSFSLLPFATITVSTFPFWLLVGSYCCYFFVLKRFYAKNAKEDRVTDFLSANIIEHF